VSKTVSFEVVLFIQAATCTQATTAISLSTLKANVVQFALNQGVALTLDDVTASISGCTMSGGRRLSMQPEYEQSRGLQASPELAITVDISNISGDDVDTVCTTESATEFMLLLHVHVTIKAQVSVSVAMVL
jgi:hypothetical protein